ncbi:DUF1028 domain-containing protein [Paracoccaceae bacterium]|nr:DUF1028 domain-containing protein [Paracoccaceae bacterium]
MTFSILVRDPETGFLGAAAATGNLCVGGWVLRGDARVGLSASQGHMPSTLWGEDVLVAMGRGLNAESAVAEVVNADSERGKRQLLALDRDSDGAIFSGDANLPVVSEFIASNCVVAGNMLANHSVINACHFGFASSHGPLESRLLNALKQAADAGGDVRGLESAAILVVSDEAPPVNLRVDYSNSPLTDLGRLIQRAKGEKYAQWRSTLPTRKNPLGEI